MAIVEESIAWIGERDFPQGREQELTIAKAELVSGRNGKPELELTVVTRENEIRRLSIWGDNKNKLIKKLGKETDAWQGKQFHMGAQRREGKLYKEVR